MLLGRLRRREVLGLRLADVNAGERRLFIAEGKGGRQRILPVSPGSSSPRDYLDRERPRSAATEKVFVVPATRRGRPLSPAGLDEILSGARARAGLTRLTCHMLRHTCFTRPGGGGHGPGGDPGPGRARLDRDHLIYLHLANGWLAEEYRWVSEAIDAQADPIEAAITASRCSSRRLEAEELIAAYRADLRAAGMFAEHPVTSPRARS